MNKSSTKKPDQGWELSPPHHGCFLRQPRPNVFFPLLMPNESFQESRPG